VNATIVPFHVAPGISEQHQAEVADALLGHDGRAGGPGDGSDAGEPAVPGTTPISELQWRSRARIGGRIKALRVPSSSDAPYLECSVVDSSGEVITLVFLGRRSVSGLHSGTRLVAEGTVGKHRGKLAIINPVFELLSVRPTTDDG
jgi:hypothetical protein